MKTIGEGVVTVDEFTQIKESIMTDGYTLQEVADMFEHATVEKTDKGITITYRNGKQDEFVFVQRLVHKSDL